LPDPRSGDTGRDGGGGPGKEQEATSVHRATV
jgi:hypothetical protein